MKIGIAIVAIALALAALLPITSDAAQRTRCVRNPDGSVTCQTCDDGGWGQCDMSRGWC
jgi:hypothetical protein